jgi:hypothetical protein
MLRTAMSGVGMRSGKCFAERVKEAATAATLRGSLAMLAAMRG